MSISTGCLPIFFLLLLIQSSNCGKSEQGETAYDGIVMDAIPEVIYEIRHANAGQEQLHGHGCQFNDLMNHVAASILHIHLAKETEVKIEKSEHSLLKENIGKTIKENEMFLEQVQKLCLAFELKHQIAKAQTNFGANQRKTMHNKNSDKMEETLRKHIKVGMIQSAKVQFGFNSSSLKGKVTEEAATEQQHKLANIEEIVEILLSQHQDAIMVILTEEKENNSSANEQGPMSGNGKSKIERKLRIAQVAPILAPYPPRKYGGLERVVSYLTEKLVHRGHEVTLISASDSVTEAKLVFKWHSLLDSQNLDEYNLSNQWLISEAIARQHEFDVIHFQTECCWDKIEKMVEEGKTKVAVTLHYLMSSKALSPLGTQFTKIPLIAISEDQQRHRPKELKANEPWNPKYVRTIHHGLPSGLYKFVSAEEQKRNLATNGEQPYLAYIGRFSERKKTNVAIEIAAKAEMRLKLAGNAFDQDYWRHTLFPLILKTNLTHRHSAEVHKAGAVAEHAPSGKHFNQKAADKIAIIQEAHKNKMNKLEEVFEKYEKQISDHNKPLKELREKEQLSLWEYLAKLEEPKHKQGLERIDTAIMEEIEQIVELDVGKLTGDRDDLIQYIGEIGDEGKKDLLGNAIAFVFPCYWPEPFGIVMIESMAFGTPVITRKLGSVGEVIEPGVSGLLFDTVDEGVAAVKKASGLDRAQVRKQFDERFTVEKMVDAYERVYDDLMEGKVHDNGAKIPEHQSAAVAEGG